jgi:type IV pilus assembly protein PilV
MLKQPPSIQEQRGITLVESLVSLVVLALGVLGLIGFQLQTLKDTKDSVGRSRAIVSIQDIAERIRINPSATTLVPNPYNVGFGPAPGAAQNCTANVCTVQQLAAWDLVRWKANATAALPGGRVAIQPSPTDPRQYAVMVCWLENTGDSAAAAAIVQNTTVSGSIVGMNLTCPAGLTGHLSYVQPFR